MADRRSNMNFLLNRESIPILDPAPPESSCTFKGEECLIGLAKGGGIGVFPTNAALHLSSERFTSRNGNHNGMDTASNSILSSGDVRNAFSLLSTSSWSSSWPEEPSSFDEFAHGSSICLSQPRMPLELQNTASNTHLQDIRSFRSPDVFARFYSN